MPVNFDGHLGKVEGTFGGLGGMSAQHCGDTL
jgi:hypothetical protein